MKKFIYLILVGFILVPGIGMAADISMVPNSGSYSKGQNLSISFYVDPSGDKIYTAKLEVKFNSDKVKIQSFAFADGLMP